MISPTFHRSLFQGDDIEWSGTAASGSNRRIKFWLCVYNSKSSSVGDKQWLRLVVSVMTKAYFSNANKKLKSSKLAGNKRQLFISLVRVAFREVLKRYLGNHPWPCIVIWIYTCEEACRYDDVRLRSVWMFESTLSRLERGSFEVCWLDPDDYDTDNGKLYTN